MTLNFVTVTHLCETCRMDGDDVKCGGPTCRLWLLEAAERAMMDKEDGINQKVYIP